MRSLAVAAVVLFLGGVAAACALWAGAHQGAAYAVALGGASLAAGIPVISDQLGRWGVPGDEPALNLRRPRGRG